MSLSPLDIAGFVGFLALVFGVSIAASRRRSTTTEDYFLAGRELNWWLIGISLVASNISTEHFVGLSGRGYELGLAIASYEWMAAVTMVVVALYFLPKFLRAGIFTMPEYLEYRYDGLARSIMAFFMMLAYVLVALATVLYSGSLALNAIIGLDVVTGIWIIGALAGLYVTYGGLRAVVWTELIQGTALLLGALLVFVLSLRAIGGWGEFTNLSAGKLHTVLPWNHPEMPWLAVFIGGLWIPNLFYWGLNQFITQRALAARSLAEGQRGTLFAAAIKVSIPFLIIMPGIMAAHIFPDLIKTPDQAYSVLIRELVPAGLLGIMLAALFGAVLSTFESLLNSAATIFSLDIYQRLWRPDAEQAQLLRVGRWATFALFLVGCLWAPIVGRAGSVFQYIQMFWGFISPGIVAVFLVGMVSPRTPPRAAHGAMLLGIPVYGLLLWFLPGVAFLHHMAITFAVVVLYMAVVTVRQPLAEPVVLPVKAGLVLTPAPHVKWFGAAVIGAVAALYLYFW
ncbi:MAG: solute:sodium symporter family transporter [Gemmatimonadales bacterium]